MRETSFITENGVLLDNFDRVIAEVPGTIGVTPFPEQLIAKLHKLQPGYINRLVHTHPCGMFGLSKLGEDNDTSMMRSWAMHMHPFPFRLSTLTNDGDYSFIESIYVARLEPKEIWEGRKEREKMSSYRKITIELESEQTFYLDTCPEWVRKLILSSFNVPEGVI